MARLFYDLHLHSCLSPCGDKEMTPNNMVNMAKLLGYDMIALTDHNSCRNTPAAVKVGQNAGITVVPGMELTTEEEAHVVCLFPTPEDALAFEEIVSKRRVRVLNDPKIFGEQLILDEDDCVVGQESDLLINATTISVEQVIPLAKSCNGTAFPAHVDKSAYSVIASLGVIPPEAGFTAAEISPTGNLHALLRTNPELNAMVLLRNSDAHYLENMPEPSAWIDLPENSAACLIQAVNGEMKVTSAWR